jgi:hypothetical protein
VVRRNDEGDAQRRRWAFYEAIKNRSPVVVKNILVAPSSWAEAIDGQGNRSIDPIVGMCY